MGGVFVNILCIQWMNRHEITILALQEVKGTEKSISEVPHVVGAEVEGYDSFWSPCRLSEGTQRGMNGVATYVKKGLTKGADRAPLGDESLDVEVQCFLGFGFRFWLSYHGRVVAF